MGVVVLWRGILQSYCPKTGYPGTRVLLPDGYPGTKIPESPSTTPTILLIVVIKYSVCLKVVLFICLSFILKLFVWQKWNAQVAAAFG